MFVDQRLIPWLIKPSSLSPNRYPSDDSPNKSQVIHSTPKTTFGRTVSHLVAQSGDMSYSEKLQPEDRVIRKKRKNKNPYTPYGLHRHWHKNQKPDKETSFSPKLPWAPPSPLSSPTTDISDESDDYFSADETQPTVKINKEFDLLLTKPDETDPVRPEASICDEPETSTSQALSNSDEREYLNQHDTEILSPAFHDEQYTLELAQKNFRSGLNGRQRNQLPENFIKSQPLIAIAFDHNLSTQDILSHYHEHQPELIRQLTVDYLCQYAQKHSSLEIYQLAIKALELEQYQHSLKDILELIEQCTESKLRPDLYKWLSTKISELHGRRLYQEIDNFNPQTATLNQLLTARDQFRLLESIHEQLKDKLNLWLFSIDFWVNPLDQLTWALKKKKNAISAKLIELWLTAESLPRIQSSHHQWFLLTPPQKWPGTPGRNNHLYPYLYIEEILEQGKNGPENVFFEAVLKYMDAINTCEINDFHDNIRQWKQCQYDVGYYQQQLLVQMTRELIKSPNHPHFMIPDNNFEQNITTLRKLTKIRKNIGEYVFNPDSYAFLISTKDLIWKQEESIEDIIADLYHEKYLGDLGYNVWNEFQDAFQETTQALPYLWNTISSAIGSVSQAIANPSSIKGAGLFSILNSGDKVKQVHDLVCNTLKTMLKVAQNNPRFFRTMWGDIALLLPQFESLFDSDHSISGLFQRLTTCLNAQALASGFSGDKPCPLDFNPGENPEIAKCIKRFQLFHDMAIGLHMGVSVLDLLINGRPHKVLMNAISTYMARRCVNPMKPQIIRFCNNLRHVHELLPKLTMDLPTGIFPTIDARQTIVRARHIGITGGLTSGAVSYYLEPITDRIHIIHEQYKRVKINNNDAEAWGSLRQEEKKMAGILTTSSVFATFTGWFVYTSSVLVLFANPMFTAALAGLSMFTSSFYTMTRRLNQLEDIKRPVREAIHQHIERVFAEDNPKAIEARQYVHELSTEMMTNLSYIQAVRQCKYNTLRLRLARYWYQCTNKDMHLEAINKSLESMDSDLKLDAHHMLNCVQTIKLAQEAMEDADAISSDPCRLALFNQKLTSHHFKPLQASAFQYRLINLLKEAEVIIFQHSGTTTPGADIPSIKNTLKKHTIEQLKGLHILNTIERKGQKYRMQLAAPDHSWPQNLQTEADREFCREGQESNSKTLQELSMNTLATMLEDIEKEINEQSILRNQQAMESFMKLVMKRSMRRYFKNESTLADRDFLNVANSSVLQMEIELQLRDFKDACSHLSKDTEEKITQSWDTDKPISGITYNFAAAAAAAA